ncbi:hypothetical protein BAE36_29535 [Rhizobium leguminosarum bv. trifolii]|uniref:Uncharacterized protein n=1 Tax=Rhizobium leguminosarum bv. trifolii TaxID=386 RepID=A0A1B8R510_RHILT|nr:hypothetical protein [Rhizobium leguminosarum]AOO93547.1 hypothetical protein [Rhizobium leguminosarum bv. trifolii]MBY5912823.1 hypothetical protein [Rhizobium leguminosarum]OBY03890.1 hypothetical protein BAE36_29535 [Rhizobium leguminosarum bv. trifolii]TBE53609.1 hypothetical protein ELH04_03890 [Rhizobium leguminosarum]TBE91259.1 hypothetical protein ELG97_04800 [Rhizobium leguminosarum]
MPAAYPTPEPSTDSPSLAAAPRAGATEKTRAKARFTAGAPDLLKALVEAERFFDGSADHGCPLHQKILAAIDTMKGSPS